jgi:hypothetical protein
MADETDPAELSAYLDAGWQLIPLHRHDYHDAYRGKRRERGKSPLDKAWTTKPYKSKKQVEHMAGGANVGVRLRATDLVIDVDPRNFDDGDDPLARLCEDVGLDRRTCPTVETGSGGLHLYLTKPKDAAVRDSLKEYPGVEFKSLGRQVVAAGSVHPNGKRYAWDFLGTPLGGTPEAPGALLRLSHRPPTPISSGGGEHTQAEVEEMLDALDPEDFRDHDEWLTLMQACHHASGGDARAEFVEWSTRDPLYADHGGQTGRRWDSMHADVDGPRVTYRTLHKIMADQGQENAISRTPPGEDFDDEPGADVPGDDGTPEHERKGPMQRMNDKYIAVLEGSKFRIMFEDEDPSFRPPRKYWVSAARRDLSDLLANRRVQRGDTAVPVVDAWMEWPGRRTADGVTFMPEKDAGTRLNLWTGWGVEPSKGSWSGLQDLLAEGLCDGDAVLYEYTLSWMAHLAQRPSEPAETAICFQGDQGTGKGTWGRALVAMAGRHGMHVTSPEHLSGRFNAHLRDCVILFADEAIQPHDRAAVNRVKAIITEPTLTFEAKGRDLTPGPNCIHLIMASNDDWFVPMSLHDERRFVLQRASTKFIGNEALFTKINKQLYTEGGISAMLWDLLERDIAGWAPRRDLPNTAASAEQKMRNAPPITTWWLNALQEGAPPGGAAVGPDDWSGSVRVFRQDLKDDFIGYCRAAGINPGASNRSNDMMFAKEIRLLVGPSLREKVGVAVPDDRPDVRVHADGRAWGMELPSLAECRRTFERRLGSMVDWGVSTCPLDL